MSCTTASSRSPRPRTSASASSTLGIGVPEYSLTDEGPDHLKVFTAQAVVGTEVLGEGVGRSKKEAEQKAAEVAWTALSSRATSPTADDSVATDADGTPSGEILERG